MCFGMYVIFQPCVTYKLMPSFGYFVDTKIIIQSWKINFEYKKMYNLVRIKFVLEKSSL